MNLLRVEGEWWSIATAEQINVNLGTQLIGAGESSTEHSSVLATPRVQEVSHVGLGRQSETQHGTKV